MVCNVLCGFHGYPVQTGRRGGGEGDGVERGGIVRPELMRGLHGLRVWGFPWYINLIFIN